MRAVRRRLLLKFFSAASLLLCVTACALWVRNQERHPSRGTAMTSKSSEAKDELAYLIDLSSRLAPDEIQVDREMEAWLDRLSAAQIAELAAAYQKADAAGHMAALTREYRADSPADEAGKWRKRRLVRLMSLFDHLGERGIEPFNSFRVGIRAVPERQVDWSAVPEDLRWVIEPAEKYGELQFESRIIDYIEKMADAEWAETRRLRARYSAEVDRLETIGAGEKVVPGTPQDLIYNMQVFFVFMHRKETGGDLPNPATFAGWAEEWRSGKYK